MQGRAYFDAVEAKKRILSRDGYRCQHCGRPARYLAHRIAQTKANIRKYGQEIIHHPDNLVSVCENPACNDWFNIGFKSAMADDLAEKIRRKI